MAKKIDLSIVIATKNEQLLLPNLLSSLKRQSHLNFETIVIDNYSIDTTVAIAKRYGARVFTFGAERSQQRNFGLSKARGTYVLFLDADMHLPPNLLAKCIAVMKKTHSPGLIIPEDVPITNWYSRIKRIEKRLTWQEPLIEAARFFKTSVVRKAGGYNFELVAGEDWDLSERIKSYGKISRIDSPLIHFNHSLRHEMSNKFYYARRIKKYKDQYPTLFAKQSGLPRIMLFWTKRGLFFEDPFGFAGLVLLKFSEYLMYLFAGFFSI